MEERREPFVPEELKSRPTGACPRGPSPLRDEEVMEHTAALWRYKPVPAEEPEPGPEYLHAGLEHPGGRIIAARVRGKKHKHEGSNCDDWYEISASGGMLFAAVSDGAGSRKLSRIGARTACRAAVDALQENLLGLWTRRPELPEAVTLDFQDKRCASACGALAKAVQRAVRRAAAEVEAAAEARRSDPAYAALLGRPPEPRDFAATLLASAVVPAGERGWLTVSCQVGDGAIALVDSKGPFAGSVKPLGEADAGPFSGETEFLTSSQMTTPEALQRRTRLSRGHSDLLLMATDGVADDYFPGEAGLRRLYFDLLANGILEDVLQAGALTPEQLRLYKRLSGPVAYPWVNDQSVRPPLHYTRRDYAAGITPEELWRNRAALVLAGLELEGLPRNPAERLLRWLDNYVERGSFDDRTLVLMQLR